MSGAAGAKRHAPHRVALISASTHEEEDKEDAGNEDEQGGSMLRVDLGADEDLMALLMHDDQESESESLISCAASSEKKEKKAERQEHLDSELVASLAAKECLPSFHGGCDARYIRSNKPISPTFLRAKNPDTCDGRGLREPSASGWCLIDLCMRACVVDVQ